MIGEPLWKMNFYKCHSVVLGLKKKKKKKPLPKETK